MKFSSTLVIMVAVFISSGSLSAKVEKEQQILRVQPKQAVVVKEEVPDQQGETSNQEAEGDETDTTDFYGEPPGMTGESDDDSQSPVSPQEESGAIAVPGPVPDPKIIKDLPRLR